MSADLVVPNRTRNAPPHTMDTLDTLTTLTRMLRERLPGLLAVYRYGSFATPAQRADSDIDLGLLADRPLDPVQLFQISAELAAAVGRDVDLIDMLTCSTVMRANIVASGELIHCRDSYRCENFATTVFSQYARLNEERRGILDDIQATGSIHGR